MARDIARACGWAVLILTVLYLLVVVAPFYGNGIHLHSYGEIAGSAVDVKGYPPFVWLGGGGPLQGIAMLASAFTPLISLVATPLLVVMLITRGRSFRRVEWAFWATTSAVNVAALALTWQTLELMRIWLVD